MSRYVDRSGPTIVRKTINTKLVTKTNSTYQVAFAPCIDMGQISEIALVSGFVVGVDRVDVVVDE